VADEAEAAVIGGGSARAVRAAGHRFELTEVHGAFGGDTTMPYPGPQWHGAPA
jgi:dihydrofolate reductase